MNDLSYDPVNWMRQYLKIVTMDGTLCPLSLNLAQLKVHNTLEMQRREGFPMRAMVLKARREGVSTYSEGRCFHEINVHPMRNAAIVSADDDATDKVFGMAKLFQEKMPSGLKRPTQYSSKKEIVYADPHRSSLHAYTAGKKVLGRGGQLHYLHLSEFAFWKDAKTQFTGISQEIQDDPGTILLIESTANGVGGEFYEMYMQAYEDWTLRQDLNTFLPIFLPWYIFPKYRMDVDSFEIGKGPFDPEWLESEEELLVRFDLTVEQLQWRRYTIKNKCQSDLATFKQEYPATIQEAFQSSGKPVFLHSRLDRQERLCSDGRRVLFDASGINDVMRSFDSWMVYQMPVPSHQYTIGIDTMEGKQSDMGDEKSGRDRHGVVVWDRDSKEVAATFRGQLDQWILGEQCLYAAEFYNKAWTAMELPYGAEVLRYFKTQNYPNIFVRQEPPDGINADESDCLGWKTTTATRPLMVEAFKTAFLDNEMRLNDRNLIQEMRDFIYDKTGKPIHASGKHDDLLFGAMIAFQVHLHSPYHPVAYQYETTHEPETREPDYDLSNANAVDPGIEYYEEDLWLTTE